MSWKTDILMVGALGVGAYLVITNADKIGAWLGSALGSGASQAAAGIAQGAANVLAVPGTAIELYFYENKLAAQQEARTEQRSELAAADKAFSAGDYSAAKTSYMASTEARIKALQVSPGGLSDVGLAAIRAQEAETLQRVFGVSAATSQPTSAPARSSAQITPFPNPAANVPGVTTFPTSPVTGVQKIGLSAEQRAEATKLVSQPGYNADQFAMPGSPAWIVAHGG